MNKKYWFLTFHIRKVTAKGPQEKFGNEAVGIHPVDWIYKMNRNNTEYYTLIQAMPLDKDRYDLLQKDCMKKGTKRLNRPSNKRPTW
jgi:hypothetical protein